MTSVVREVVVDSEDPEGNEFCVLRWRVGEGIAEENLPRALTVLVRLRG